jgi:hypothetical protein
VPGSIGSFVKVTPSIKDGAKLSLEPIIDEVVEDAAPVEDTKEEAAPAEEAAPVEDTKEEAAPAEEAAPVEDTKKQDESEKK